LAKKPLQFHEDLRREEEVRGSTDRGFGLTFAGFFALLAGLGWWRAGQRWPYYVAAAAVFAAIALVAPRILGPANRAWTKLGLLLFRVVNPVVMAVLFVTTIVPIGLLMRLAGKDPLRLRRDPDAQSYWIPREPPGPAPESMKNQF
jgi:Saxitoxin biosynthesis operon protein SxtJ